jgi:hypothetical protein
LTFPQGKVQTTHSDRRGRFAREQANYVVPAVHANSFETFAYGR